MSNLPRIIGGVCEFCGVNAAACEHAKEFKAKGLLREESTKAFIDKLRAVTEDADGKTLPRVISDVCEACGVYFLDEKCPHLKARRVALYGSDEIKDDTIVVVVDTDMMIAAEAAKKEALEGPKSKPKNRASLPKELGGDKEAPSKEASEKVKEALAKGEEPKPEDSNSANESEDEQAS